VIGNPVAQSSQPGYESLVFVREFFQLGFECLVLVCELLQALLQTGHYRPASALRQVHGPGSM